MGILSRSTTDLGLNLVVEVFGKCGVRILFVDIASSCHKLLQLYASDKVLVLRCHQAVVLRK